ncbi:MAG: hypothetical protein IT285_02315 [Bdellovibrionales bacterium]|nr:hypothetical protein [Bdellovibrionales bacterium]
MTQPASQAQQVLILKIIWGSLMGALGGELVPAESRVPDWASVDPGKQNLA